MNNDILRGHSDAIILAGLENGDTYGYSLNKNVVERTGGQYEFKEATLYSAIRRLEQTALINSYWGDETAGPRRRYYSLTDKGRNELTRLREEWNAAKQIIDSLIINLTEVE